MARRTGSKRFPRPALPLATLLWLAVLLAVFMAAGAARADTPDPIIAKRDDEQIQKLAGQLQKKLAEKAGLEKEPAVVLYRVLEFDSQQKSHAAVDNYVLLINDPGHEAARRRSLGFTENAALDYLGGWIWRERKVIRLDRSSWRIDKDAGNDPQEAVSSFPQLKKGDLVCYSVEAKYDYPFMGQYLRLSEALPVMLYNARVSSGGFFSPEFLGQNLVNGKHAQKVYQEKEGYPTEVKYTVADIPADRQDPDGPPFYAYQPFLQVYPKAYYNDQSGTWMEFSSWNLVAYNFSGYRKSLGEEIDAVKSKAQSLTAGLTTDAEMADALYRFIQDDVKLTCFFDNHFSSKPRDCLARHQATRRGKSALLYAMAMALDLPVDVLLSRDAQLGSLNKSAVTLDQFTDFIIVLKGQPDRYYVPTVQPCPPGELPPGLRGRQALATKSDLGDAFRELAIEASGKASANPANASAIFNGLLQQKDWSEWVTLP